MPFLHRRHRLDAGALGAGAFAAATIAYAGISLLGWPGKSAEWAANIGTAVGSLGVVVLAARASRTAGLATPLRRAWMLLAVSYGFAFAGDALWLFLENVLHQHPEPSLADLAYLLSYPLLLAGALAFPRTLRSREERAKFWLDALTVVVGGGMCVWYFVIYPTLHQPGSLAARMVAVAYPVGDLVALLGLATVLLRRRCTAERLVILLLAGGVSLELAGDLVLSYLSVAGDYQTGGLADFLWIASYALVLLSAALQRRQGASGKIDEDAALDRPVRPLPYAAVALGYAILAWEAAHRAQGALSGLVVGALVLTALVVARQVIAIRENARLEAAAAERRSELRFRSLVQNSSDVITVLDASGLIRYASASAERVLGYPCAELEGLEAVAILHPEDQDAGREFFRSLRDERRAGTLECRIRHGRGHWVHVEHTGTNMLDDGEVAGLVVNTRDVTDRLELEQRLRQSQKMEAIGRLAGGVAHDFNNLLTAIQGNAQLLLSEPGGENGAEHAAEIKSAAQRAAGLTRQLLAFSRKQVIQAARVHWCELVPGMEQLLRRLLPEHIHLQVEVNPDTPPVHADRAQLEQILLNLALNARDAMPGGGCLALVTGPAALPDGTPAAELVVRDDGVGIEPNILPRIFEPFFTTKSQGEGTGLGLATVYGIVEQSGGSISVQSTPGSGSTFRILLPADAGPPATAAPAHPDRGRREGAETILLVEDEIAVRALAERILRKRGYTVLTAADGTEALARSQTHPGAIHLLLSDVIMPGLGGPEIARRLTRERPGLRVLLVSGYTGDTLASGDAGWAFLEKPFSPDDLELRVRQVLDGPVLAAG